MEKGISDFLNNEYKKFSFHIIENRALQSICDGLKPTQRKILYVASKHIRNVFNTVETLAGRCVSDVKYHHGSSSAEGAIVNMCQEFKNNVMLFEKDGQFGSLKSQISSSPRYIKVKLHENFDLIYKDEELLEYKVEEGEKIEPKYYLPIIPMVLLNGNSGIAIGFASNILNRDPKLIVKECLSYLNGGKISQLKPHIETFIGTFKRDSDNYKKWYIKGTFEKENTTTIKISELPPSMSYEKFEEHLDNLLDKNEIIKWENHGKGNINYIIKFSRDRLLSLDNDSIDKLLKLTDQVTENFTILDENGKLKIFDSVEEIVKYFVDFRLSYYVKRKDYQLEKLNYNIRNIDSKIRFVQAIIEEKIVINKKTKDDIIKQITKLGLETKDDSYDYLLSMPIHSLSKEKWEALKAELKDKKDELKVIKSSNPKEIYIEELEELRKKL